MKTPIERWEAKVDAARHIDKIWEKENIVNFAIAHVYHGDRYKARRKYVERYEKLLAEQYDPFNPPKVSMLAAIRRWWNEWRS